MKRSKNVVKDIKGSYGIKPGKIGKTVLAKKPRQKRKP